MMKTLLNLNLNDQATISHISHPDADMKQRLYDLGFYPGTTVKKSLISPKSDPIAYRLRGTTIALRNSDSQYVEVSNDDN